MLDSQFLSQTAELNSPLSGTEHLAPLFYSLIRSIRPRSVVEFGMGYSTPFILKALADNLRDFTEERAQLIAKTQQAQRSKNTAEDQKNWFLSQPVGADPRFYEKSYQPILYAFDDFSEQYSSAAKVLAVLENLQLKPFLHFSPSTAIEHSNNISKEHLPIDLAWNDAIDYQAFYNEYWPLLNPNGGLMIFHNTVNACPRSAMFIKNLKIKQVGHFTDFEILSFLESYKLHQNSYTIIRKISGFKESYLDWDKDSITQSSLRLMQKKTS